MFVVLSLTLPGLKTRGFLNRPEPDLQRCFQSPLLIPLRLRPSFTATFLRIFAAPLHTVNSQPMQKAALQPSQPPPLEEKDVLFLAGFLAGAAGTGFSLLAGLILWLIKLVWEDHP